MVLRTAADGVRLAVRLTPRASADRLQGIAADADGIPHLKVQVTAPPEGGKANAALIKLLAKTFRCPKTSLSIASGATDRTKVVAISGAPQDLTPRIDAALAGLRRER